MAALPSPYSLFRLVPDGPLAKQTAAEAGQDMDHTLHKIVLHLGRIDDQQLTARTELGLPVAVLD